MFLSAGKTVKKSNFTYLMGRNRQSGSENFIEIMEKLLLPFREEYRQKCRNRSVIGGFDSYLIRWLNEAMKSCNDDGNVKKCLVILSNEFKNYNKLKPVERANLLKQTHPVITDLKEGKVPLENIFFKDKWRKDVTVDSCSSHEQKGTIKIKSDGNAIIKNAKVKTVEKAVKTTGSITLDSPVSDFPGIGAKISSLFKKLNINTVSDLFFHFPREYQDRRNFIGFDKIEPGKFQVLLGTIGEVHSRNIRQNLKITKAAFYDENGLLNLIWFNRPHIARSLKQGRQYIVSGIVEYKYGEPQINSPEIEEWDGKEVTGKYLTPVYPLTEGLSQKFIRKVILSSVQRYADLLVDVFPGEFLNRLDLPILSESIKTIHQPESSEEAFRARKRVLFEEAFFMQMLIARHRRMFRKIIKEREYKYSPAFLKEFEDNLEFYLTKSQREVIGEILEDMQSGVPMNRLLQGDVGSGKTIVCILFTLLAVRSGYQAAIMAPTEVLAEQHYYNFCNILNRFGVKTGLLIGATPKNEKLVMKTLLETGQLNVVVGTHALIQEDVNFSSLAFAVVDEQHKFGVIQRASLKEKGQGTDFLFTTATPIPRSLCLSVYGELDISTIGEMPPGRQPVNTIWATEAEKERVYAFVEKEINDGGQAFIICPIIEESEKLELTPLMNEFELVRATFPDCSVGLLHGRMKSSEKEEVMKSFSSGEYKILVSTTVVEVGVDVSNASVMVILDAQRYGLGQLHQLRGRVGRGKWKSTCILVSKSGAGDSGKRLRILTRTNSGFDIAEEDLKLRGPGDLMGVKQSGLPELKFLDIVRDYDIILKAREEVFRLERNDPELSGKDMALLKEKVLDKFKKIWDIIH